MTFSQGLLLFCAAILGGTLNAVAGGGSFICFPALVFTGLPAIPANATNSVALWPGSVASVGAYRRELVQQKRIILIVMVCTSLLGGILGALLLLKTPQEIFVRLVPYLLLVATLLFTFSGPIVAWLRGQRQGQGRATAPALGNDWQGQGQTFAPILEKGRQFATPMLRKEVQKVQATGPVLEQERHDAVSILEDVPHSVPALVGLSFAQLVIAVYGGYFGGGIGI